jgi:hypothetical protein
MKFKTFGAYALASLTLSYLTLSMISIIERSWNSSRFGDLADIVAYPGALFAGLFYPEGIHTGRGSIGSVYVTIAGNTFFYALLWFAVLRTVAGISRRHVFHRDEGEEPQN